MFYSISLFYSYTSYRFINGLFCQQKYFWIVKWYTSAASEIRISFIALSEAIGGLIRAEHQKLEQPYSWSEKRCLLLQNRYLDKLGY